MAKTKTEEDWFLRGGERPNADDAFNKPGNPHENNACDMCDGHHHCDECPHLTDGELPEDEPGKICQNCGVENLAENERCVCCGAALTGGCPTDEYCGADDGDDGDGKLKTYTVTVTRTKTVDQYIELRVMAKDEDEAEDVAVKVAKTQADANWTDDIVDYGYIGIEDIEEAE